MKIDNSNDQGILKKLTGKRVSIKRIVISLILVIILLGMYLASPMIKSKGYTGLWDFATSVTSNYFKGLKADPEEIAIEIKDDDYKKLEKNRKQALERGVIINDMDGEYVSATMLHKGKKIDIKLRLKGHMTDHLQNNKWSFRVKTKGNDSFMGMKRFSIQHPGTRGYIYEWIYHELMKREEIIALRYQFIKIKVNGNDWGIYAVEENFENELLENNHRKKGPILRFNPDLYWINRYNMMTRESSSDEFAAYYSANPEAYREDKVLEDTVQYNYYLKAIALIEGMRSGSISVDQAFDIERLAKFHAIIDLVGGVHSIDWSDIKYYYNPVNSRLEPVAYESFTNLSSRDLSCLYKFTMPDSVSAYVDWHTMIFSDKTFFKEYVRQLDRLTSTQYLDNFFTDSNVEMNKNLAIIYKEFPYKKFEKSLYYKRQKMIRKILDSPKAVHAYLKEIKGNTVVLQVGSIDALPVHIRSITYKGIPSITAGEIILPAKQPKTYVRYSEISFLLEQVLGSGRILSDSLLLQYSILGSSEIKEIMVFPFPHTDSEFIAEDLNEKQSTVGKFPLLQMDEKNKMILIRSGKLVLNSDLIIPAGYQMIVKSGVNIDLKNSSKIISYSPVFFEGVEEDRIIVESSDSTSQGIQIINADKSRFIYVTFKNLPEIKDKRWNRTGALTFYESSVDFSFCNFYNCQAGDAVNLIRSEFKFKECLFQKMKAGALNIDFSEGTLDHCAFEHCRENVLDIMMGNVKLNSVYIDGAGNKALKIKSGSQVKGIKVNIKNVNIAISAEDHSLVELENISITDSKIGVAAFQNKRGAGYPKVNLKGLEIVNVKTDYLKEKKASISSNGSEVQKEMKEVETIIKDEKYK